MHGIHGRRSEERAPALNLFHKELCLNRNMNIVRVPTVPSWLIQGLVLVAVIALAIAVRHHSGPDGIVALGVGMIPAMGAILDAQAQFSASQALVATAVSTNLIDQGPPNTTAAERRLGSGTPMCVLLTVGVAPAGGGTLQIDVQSDDNVGFASAAIVATTGAVAAASLPAGAIIAIPIPPRTKTERFLRLNYTMVTMTSITVSSSLIPQSEVPSDVTYPKGFLVSS